MFQYVISLHCNKEKRLSITFAIQQKQLQDIDIRIIIR